MKKEWKQPDDDLLRNLWDQGLSAAKIGDAMGLTKNAIVGRAHRLKLTARKSPIIREPGQKAPYPRERRIRNGQRQTLAVVAPQIAAKPTIQAPLPVSVSPVTVFRPMSPRSCQFPLWGRTRPTHRYCEAPTASGQSYCPEHRAICWVKPLMMKLPEVRL